MPKIRGVKPDLWTDEDFVELSPYARLLWIGLWNFACDNGHLQDKSKQIKLRILPTDDVNCADLLREIEAQGLIERAGGWLTIPNLSHHQKPHRRWWSTCDMPGCELPEGASHAPANRGATVAPPKGNRGATADSDGDGEGEGEGEKRPRTDVATLCNLLADHVEANGSKRPTVTKKWLDACRLMLDKDGRTFEEVRGAILWSQADEFWRSNILSMPKLREKYDVLRLQAQRQRTGSTDRRQAETDAIFDEALARGRS